MGRPENENAIFKKDIFFDMLLRRIKPNEIQKKKLHNLIFPTQPDEKKKWPKAIFFFEEGEVGLVGKKVRFFSCINCAD